MNDSLANGQRVRLLTLVDNMSRESPTIEVDRSLTGHRVVAVLERAAARYGLPKVIQGHPRSSKVIQGHPRSSKVIQGHPRSSKVIQVGNGPEFTSRALDTWAHLRGIKLAFSRPGAPTDNPFIEAFNGRIREERLDQQWFYSLEEARNCLEEWRRDYNTVRPHTVLGNQTPAAFLAEWHKQQPSREIG
jgi:putative transposase